jgi:4-amino-4-deoxy-L-arabinose transferase-like glycosyltransferase
VKATVVAGVLAFGYLWGFFSDPPKWEEPRRCLVTHEMVHRGDYVVPRIYGTVYRNKPPLQHWLIAMFSGFDTRRVGAPAARAASLVALLAIALGLWRLGLGEDGPDPLPAVAFLTMAIVIQYGRAGEIDMPFAAFVFGAIACFEAGRRRGSPALQWVGSQALVGLGLLAKWIAPVFFYPPILLEAWRERRRWPVMAAGLLVMGLVVLSWLVPYSRQASAADLWEHFSHDTVSRAVPAGATDLLRHVARYPFVVLGVMLPWSLAILGGPAAWRAPRGNPWLRLCRAAATWGAAVFLLTPAGLGRYLIPVLPCAAVVLAAMLRRMRPWVTRALLAIGLLSAVLHVFLVEPHAAAKNRLPAEAAAGFHAVMSEPLPVACSPYVDRRLAWALVHALDRPLIAYPPAGEHYFLTPSDRPPARPATAIASAAGHDLWRVE